ncbi:hypothetical protein MtrunA17_Chr3g0107921 [Medicago truncatula]|uniref:Transmembrane protein n=1 Tax=Medicago truncatula TaxID=3880 RepID=A0A396ITV6_MEDTR|nr:hypothetical protein MtrunA17_Chr3g0107921 [Medicago truncatula]
MEKLKVDVDCIISYEARTLLGLGMIQCQTRVGIRHRHNTYDYIKLYRFLKLLSVLTYWCLVVSGVRVCVRA